jgi:outer membrane protein assembly factor BamD
MLRLSRSALLLLACAAAIPLAGCATGRAGKGDTSYVARDVSSLYSAAKKTMDQGDYEQAAKLFDEVERQHPYSVWATKSQLMGAYAHYEEGKYDEAVIAADRFIQLHPGNRDVAYAYYLKALSYYIQIVDVGRDQQTTQKALKALDDVVRRFPDTRYARDARLKLDLARDHLAGKDMEIGRFYEKQGQYLAAINRFRRVVDTYQTTTHVPEALHRLTECYLALGVVDEAKATASVLGYNYPGSEWYQDSYALLTGIPAGGSAIAGEKPPQPGWFSRVVGSIF